MGIRDSREKALKEQMIALLPRLRRFARNLTGATDKGDDLVQAACERALTRFDQVQEGTRLESWLYRIIHTRWIDKIRREKTRRTYAKSVANNNSDSNIHEDISKRIETTLDIQKAVYSLPEENRAALMLVCVEGYSYAEAAAVLSVPVGTVASRMARARAMMSDYLLNDKRPVIKSFKKVKGALK